MMLIAGVGAFLGVGVIVALGILTSQRASFQEFQPCIEAIGLWNSVVVPLIFSIGFFGVCQRWQGIASKVKELEV
jgi:hypothetical protein